MYCACTFVALRLPGGGGFSFLTTNKTSNDIFFLKETLKNQRKLDADIFLNTN